MLGVMAKMMTTKTTTRMTHSAKTKRTVRDPVMMGMEIPKGGVRGTQCGIHPQDLPPSWIYKIGVPCYAAYVKAYHAGMHSTTKFGKPSWYRVSEVFVMPTSA
jgi:hypothetical protein